MRFIILDTETTGIDPEVDRVVEFAAMELRDNGDTRMLFDFLCDPEIPIPPEASAVHHLTAKHVTGLPSFHNRLTEVLGEFEREPETVLVAHKAEFDSAFMPPMNGVKWLCSMRLAKHIWPDAISHSNQYLRYWLGLDIETGAPHRALADVEVTIAILKQALATRKFDSVDEMIELANSPAYVKIMPLGKHFKKRIEEVPLGYLKWAINSLTAADSDLRYTMRLRIEELQGQTKQPASEDALSKTEVSV